MPAPNSHASNADAGSFVRRHRTLSVIRTRTWSQRRDAKAPIEAIDEIAATNDRWADGQAVLTQGGRPPRCYGLSATSASFEQVSAHFGKRWT